MGRMPYLSIGHSYKEQDYYLVEEYAKKFGIEHLLHKGINNISGGEKQLVLLTRSMLQDTPYIIMDEPFSALDLGNQHKIMGMCNDSRENFRIFVSLYLILLIQLGDRDCSIWYIAKQMLSDNEREEMSALDAKRDEKLGPGKPRSIQDLDDLYLSQDEVNALLSGMSPYEDKENDKPNEKINEGT